MTRVFGESGEGSYLLGVRGIFWALNYWRYSGGSWFLGFLGFYFYSSFLGLFFSLRAASSSFFLCFSLAANFFYSFLNCCLDNPIRSPSDRVSGSFLFSSSSFFSNSFFYSFFSGSIPYLIYV